jgi:uncharacterized protein YndB with AHSA1/START domain
MSSGEVSIDVAASPADVWALVSDLTRTGEWSPECVGVDVLDSGPIAAGSRFVGHNQQGSRTWDMHGVVDRVVPEREFAFHTERDGQVRTRWAYRLEPQDGGTRLTESWERVAKIGAVQRLVERLVLGGRQQHNEANVRASLERIKALVETT